MWNRSLIEKAGRVEMVTKSERGVFNRLLAHIYVDGELLAVHLIKAGLAYETASYFGDDGFPEEAKRIIAAFASLKSHEMPKFMKPYKWRKLHQVKVNEYPF